MPKPMRMEQNLSHRRAEQGGLAPFVGVALAALTIGSIMLFSVIAQKASREGFTPPSVTAEAPSEATTRSITLAPAASRGGGDTAASQNAPDDVTQSILSADSDSAAATPPGAAPLGGPTIGPADGVLVLLDQSSAEALESLDASAELLALAGDGELGDLSTAELRELADEAELVDVSTSELLALADEADLLESGDEPELSASASRPEEPLRPFASEGSSSGDTGARDAKPDDGKKVKGSKKGDRSKDGKRSKQANRSKHRNERDRDRSRPARRSNRAAGNQTSSRAAGSNRTRPAAKPAQPASKPARPARSAKASPRREPSKAKSSSSSSEPKRHSANQAPRKRKR